ncbi:MAG: CDP-diacylglycerol--serine O-phosphatidyltransferase, partial [Betaproteobacteria bacterium AqS2]|nr:CDP-diacylglycerol--serine O-phosphatidyltransferase [Betaproteobacteria bacterium AqS2]
MAEAAPGGGPPPRDQPPPDKKDPVPVIEYRRVVYLIPNLFTALALLLGFYAIFKAVDGEFQTAGLAIIIASVMDAMDGRVARMINAESAFGAQFDSLSDALCFGLAPVVLAHQWGLHEFGRIGFIAGFFFCAAAIIRLARFNISHGLVDPRYFSGLPSPLAGILVASLVLVVGTEPSLGEALLVMLTMLVISATMVSDFRFYSFKDINLRARVQTPAMMLAVLVAFAFITLMLLEFGVLAILLFCLAYLASGFAISSRYLLRRLKRFFRGLSASD